MKIFGIHNQKVFPAFTDEIVIVGKPEIMTKELYYIVKKLPRAKINTCMF